MTTVISTSRLSAGYPQGRHRHKLILSDVNISLHKGELTALIGANGAGKSTLIRTLTGIQKPLFGTVTLSGQDISRFDRREMARRISLVLTDRVETGNLSVYELVSLGRHPHTDWTARLSARDEDSIEQALQAVGVSALKQQLIGELSDGQLQKVMLARAIAQDGELLVLDEPTAHLDIISRTEIMMLLREIAINRQKAVLISTHDLELALQTAHRFWIIGTAQQAGGQTTSALYSGIPEDMVLNGIFEATFGTEKVYFDRKDGIFRVHSAGQRRRVCLSGEGEAAYWTKRLLEKSGYQCVESPAGCIFTIRVEQQQEQFRWIINERSESHSLEQLLSIITNDRE